MSVVRPVFFESESISSASFDVSIVALTIAVPASVIAPTTAAPTAAAVTITASSAATATLPAVSAASPSPSKDSDDSSTSSPAVSAESPTFWRSSLALSASPDNSLRVFPVMAISVSSSAIWEAES